MRILFVSDTYYPHINGVYYFVCRVAPLLQDKGHQVAVIAPSDTLSFNVGKIDGIKVYGMPSVPTLYYKNFRLPVSFRLKDRIERILDEFKPDIIHIQDHFLISKTVLKVAMYRGIPIIGTNHFMPENLTALFRSQKLKKWIEKYSWSQFSAVYNQLSLVTTPTETAANLIRPKLNTPVIAISSGIDLLGFSSPGSAKAIRRKYSIPDKPVLLYVGRLDPEKHIEEILEALPLVAKTLDICFVIVGKGVVRSSLERRAHALGIADSVVFTGFVPDEDLPFLYQLSRCFIIASIAELLSLATLQAMACGLPIIAADAGALPELVQENGYLFQPGDIYEIVYSIKEIFSRNDLCQRMSRKSLEHVAIHDLHKIVTIFEEVYSSLVIKEPDAISYEMFAV